MSTAKRRTQRNTDRNLNGVTLLNDYAVQVLQRASSTKIQCTSDDGKVLIEENEDEVEKGGDISKRTTQSSCQQESIPPVVPTSNESSETSIESKTSTKVEEQACGTVKAWIKRKLHFFSRKNKSAANDFKNVA